MTNIVNFNDYPKSFSSAQAQDLRDILSQIQSAFSKMPQLIPTGESGFRSGTLQYMGIENSIMYGGNAGNFANPLESMVSKLAYVTSGATQQPDVASSFLYIPVVSAAPTVTPTPRAGCVPICFVPSTNRLYVHSAGWKSIQLA